MIEPPKKALVFIPKPSEELILIAEKEWEKKQRLQHDKASWISGYLEGYFSKPVNIKQHDDSIREEERKRVIGEVFNIVKFCPHSAGFLCKKNIESLIKKERP